MRRRRPWAIRWHRNGLTPPPGEDRCLTKEKAAWANKSLCLKWWAEVRVGDSQ